MGAPGQRGGYGRGYGRGYGHLPKAATLPAPVHAPLPNLTPSFTGQHPFAHRRGLLVADVSLTPGRHTDRRPLPAFPGLRRTGATIRTFFDDVYNRIYILPPRVDFGAIGTAAKRDVTVWNAFLHTVTLRSFAPDGDTTGVSLVPRPPVAIVGLARLVLTVAASPEGPPTLDAAFDLDFGPGGTGRLALAGRRAVLWPFAPNWRARYEKRLTFRTTIVTSRAGREQRRALMAHPRQQILFTALAASDALADDLATLDRHMASWGHRTFVVPDDTRRAIAPAGMADGARGLVVAAAPPWLQAGMDIALIAPGTDSSGTDSSGRRRELRTVTAVTTIPGRSAGMSPASRLVAFSVATPGAWPPGTGLHPALPCVLPRKTASQRHTTAVAEAQLTFDVVPGDVVPGDVVPGDVVPGSGASGPDQAAVTYRGREVWLRRPDWSRPLRHEYLHWREALDYRRGRLAFHHPVDFRGAALKASWLLDGEAEIEAMLAFFLRRRGRQTAFHMPTWQHDLPLAAASPRTSDTAHIRGRAVLEAYATDRTHRTVIATLPDGRHQPNRIRSMVAVRDGRAGDARDTLVTFHDRWIMDLPATTAKLSWAPLTRLASDRLVLRYRLPTVATALLATQTVLQ